MGTDGVQDRMFTTQVEVGTDAGKFHRSAKEFLAHAVSVRREVMTDTLTIGIQHSLEGVALVVLEALASRHLK